MKIEEFVGDLSFDQFVKDEKTMEAVVRKLEIIGEAARNVPYDITNKHPEILWEKMVSMRNKVLHEYFGVDEEIVWQTIKEDLPMLKEQVKRLLAEN